MGFHANPADVMAQLGMTLKVLAPIWGIGIALVAVQEMGDRVLTKIFGDEWREWYGLKPKRGRRSSSRGGRSLSSQKKSSSGKQRQSEISSTRPRRTTVNLDPYMNQTIRVENGKVTITYDRSPRSGGTTGNTTEVTYGTSRNTRTKKQEKPKKAPIIPAIRDTANTIIFPSVSAPTVSRKKDGIYVTYISPNTREVETMYFAAGRGPRITHVPQHPAEVRVTYS